MLNLRAHHLLCLIIPDPNEFPLIAREKFHEKGYTEEYINAYMKAFEIARKNQTEKIKILDNPKEDDTCKYCHNYKGSECTSPHANTFAQWDREVLSLLGLRVGNIIKVGDLRKLVKEKIDPYSMPGVCKGCLFDLNEKCSKILICTSTQGNTTYRTENHSDTGV